MLQDDINIVAYGGDGESVIPCKKDCHRGTISFVCPCFIKRTKTRFKKKTTKKNNNKKKNMRLITLNAVTISIKGMLAQAIGKGPLLPVSRRVGQREPGNKVFV